MSINWLLDAEPAPAILVLPPAAASLDEANAAIEMWEHYSRKKLDPTQRLTVQVMMAQADDGRWAAQTTGREMPRQNGKGDEIEVVELWGLVQRCERILHTIHDAVLLATQAQQRLLSVLEHSDLRRKVKRKWQGTGQQMIEMRNGGTIWYRTRTGGGGRGVDDIDRLVVDEAQHATEEHLSAVAPTLLANPNPQMNVAGTAGLVGKSEWWWDLRIRALSPDPGDLGYVGHTAERVYIKDGKVVQEPVDVEDRELWRQANPSLWYGRASLAKLEEAKRNLKDGFAAEHLGVWAPPEVANRQPKLPADAWAATLSAPTDAGPGQITISFDVSKDGEWSSIAIGAGTILAPYVEVIEHRKAVGWLPHRLVDLVNQWHPLAVGCNAAGPAGGQVGPILQAFRDADIDADLLRPMNASDYKSACGGFYSDVVEGRLRRPDGQGPLDLAAADAAERPLGDAWAWDVRQATVPISPLVAVTIARALLPTEVPAGAIPLKVW